MFLTAYDASRVIHVSLHVGDAMTESDVDRVVSGMDAMVDAVASNQAKFATNIVIVEADAGPTAKQRKRIGEASKRLTRSYQVIVTESAIIRAVATAIKWFSMGDKGNVQQTFAKWPEARAWLVDRTSHSAEALDALVSEVRRNASRG